MPDTDRAERDGRRALSEAVAIQCCLAAQKEDLATLRTVINALVARNDAVVSAGVRRQSGKLMAVAGKHADSWRSFRSDHSTPDQIVVPIRRGQLLWGRVEIAFRPLEDASWLGMLRHPLVRLTIFITVVGFCGYAWYLKRTLNHLDPSAVIPERVRATLDTLVEGVLVLDKEQRIVLANKAFTETTGKGMAELQGCKANQFEWCLPASDTGTAELPWARAIRDGASQSGIILGLLTSTAGKRTFAVNSMPIAAPNGRQCGVLATFDDVTSIEKKNAQLEQMLAVLHESRDEIRRQNEELTVLATHDPLTSCLNRRAFFKEFETRWTLAIREGRPLACLMVDVDHFKAVNDTHGHSVGDQVLQDLAAILLSRARPGDLVCRYGGEEFCMLFGEADLQEAQAYAERLRQAIAEQTCGNIAVTASLGVSSTESGAREARELLDQADNALYFSKRSGRNRVTIWPDVPEDMELAADAKRNKSTCDVEADVPIPFHAVTALISALAYRDAMTAEHSRRVADLCVATARGLVSERDCYILEVAALLHDIGKLGVPDSILLKPGPLTEDEWKVMGKHDRFGVEIISTAFSSPELTAIVRTHHAWYVGNPRDPALPIGEDIPVAARILSIADAFDAMVSDRVYRKGCDREQAFAELRRYAGRQFDPQLVERLIDAVTVNDQSRAHPALTVAKQAALRIGVQIERLATALDARDFPSISAMAARLANTAGKEGIPEIAQVAAELEQCSAEDPDLFTVVELTTSLLELCRSTQTAYLTMDLATVHAAE